MPVKEQSILLFGPPRSGTTWLASVMCRTGAVSVHEPDNGKNNFSGLFFQRTLPRYPLLHDQHPKAENYLNLFRLAVEGKFISSESRSNALLFRLAGLKKETVEKSLENRGRYPSLAGQPWFFLINTLPPSVRPAEQRRVVKSVHGFLNIDFLSARIEFIPLVVIRHPLAVLHSMARLEMPDINRVWRIRDEYKPILSGQILEDTAQLTDPWEQAGFQIGMFHSHLSEWGKAHPGHLFMHEEFVNDPEKSFRRLFEVAGLKWSASVKEFIDSTNRPGSGYELVRDREQVNRAWEGKFSSEEILAIARGYHLFDHQPYSILQR